MIMKMHIKVFNMMLKPCVREMHMVNSYLFKNKKGQRVKSGVRR